MRMQIHSQCRKAIIIQGQIQDFLGGGSESGVDLEGIGANISDAGELGSMHMHSPPAEAMGYYSAWLIFLVLKCI